MVIYERYPFSRCDYNIMMLLRGLVDGLAFVTKECLEKSCISAGISTDLFKRYDCVFHLVTAAGDNISINPKIRFHNNEMARKIFIRKHHIDTRT